MIICNDSIYLFTKIIHRKLLIYNVTEKINYLMYIDHIKIYL